MTDPHRSSSTPLAPLRPGARLVHLGPHKTGTTAVQQAFHEARDRLSVHGVLYAGTQSQAYREAIGLTGKRGHLGDAAPREEDWLRLVAEARTAGDARWVVSSESFANAGPEHVRRLASDLGPQVHAVRMVRRYDALVPSQWQQWVAAGKRQAFPRYVDALTSEPDGPFWRRHGFVPLTKVWADGVGRDRTTVVVVNEDDRAWLLRVFEALLGLPDGLLVVPEEDTNRSLTGAETELLRRLNQLRTRQRWADGVHLAYVRRGVSPALRQLAADPQDGRVELPPASRAILRQRTTRDLEGLQQLGVRVVGDPAWLLMDDDGDHADAHRTDREGGSLRVESVLRGVRAVVQAHLEGPELPLGGAGAALVAPRPEGRRRPLAAGERRLLSTLEAEPWPDAVIGRFVHRGLARWLRRSRAAPRLQDTLAVDDPDRVDPACGALGLAGVIAQTDPSAVRSRG